MMSVISGHATTIVHMNIVYVGARRGFQPATDLFY